MGYTEIDRDTYRRRLAQATEWALAEHAQGLLRDYRKVGDRINELLQDYRIREEEIGRELQEDANEFILENSVGGQIYKERR